MAQDRDSASDPLAKKAADVERLRGFVEDTSFSGDEREVADELSTSDQHPADHSDVTEQRARDYVIKQVLDQEADQIREAMRRREEGTYGICENCGRPISPERLEARPEATLCIDCARAQQQSA